jgi:hypothetical protein
MGKVYEVRGAGRRGRDGIFALAHIIKSGDFFRQSDKGIPTRALLVHQTSIQTPGHRRKKVLVMSHEPRLERQPTARAWISSINQK